MTSVKAAANPVPAPRSVVPAVRRTSPGRPLPAEVRLDAESRFGHDFSRVRIYADDHAARAAAAASARAFTLGSDIFFETGQYAPLTAAGFRLLAHELSHVVQTDRRGRGPSAAVAARDSEAERQARRWAAQAAHGPAGPAAGETAAPPHVLMREAKTEDAPAAVEPDFAWLAFEVFDAMDGPGTDEERVYRALEQLRKDPDLIRKFREAYKKYGNLDKDLDGDFSGSELEYALQLINRGTPGSDQEVVAGKAGPSDLPDIARRLQRAFFDEPGTDEEAVFAQLVRLDHDPKLIGDLEKVYRTSSNGGDLRATLEDEMSGNEYQHALSLISVPYEHWIRRANEELRGVKFGIPWGSWCGPEPKESRFPDAYDVRYWDQVDDVRDGNIVGCKLALKKDVRPSVAVAALIEEQDRWGVDCAGFVQMAHWYAMLKVAGPNRFDAAVGGPFELKKSQSTGVRTVKTFKAHAPGEAMEVHLPKDGELVRDPDATPVDLEQALTSAPVGSRVMWTNRIFNAHQKFGADIDVARDFENENSLKLGPNQYGAFPLRAGARKVMSRTEIEQLMAQSAVSVYPELSVAEMLKYVFIAEIELIDPALTGPEGARGATTFPPNR